MSAVEIRPVTGVAVEPWLDDLAKLRLRVFRDYPYLYDGSLDYEKDYLEQYANSVDSVFVLALENNLVVGAATGLPLSDADPAFRQAIAASNKVIDKVFYFGESVLLPEYRGEGIGHRFFDLREYYAADFGYTDTCFCSVQRAADDPRCPPDYRPLESFWRGRGYQPEAGMTASFAWTDVGDQHDSDKTLQFWWRQLPTDRLP